MRNPRFHIPDSRFPSSLRSAWGRILGRSASILLFLVAAASSLAGEAIYLQSGEEYEAAVTQIAGGQLHAIVAGKPQAFPLDQVQRIEFQRRRLHDDVTKAAELPARLPLFAEALAPKTEDLRQRFPQASHVILADETVLTMSADSAWELKHFRAWRILDERGADSSMRSLAYFPGRQEAEVLFALTVAPDGTVSHLADTAMKDEALYSRLPAYNFVHRLRFTLKGPVPGATLIVATALRGRASLLQPAVLDKVFQESEPILRASVRVAVDPKVAANMAVATANGPKDWGKDSLWEIKDSPQIFREPLMPPEETFAPRLLVAYPKAEWADVARAFVERAGGPASFPTKGVPPRALFDQVRQTIRLEDVSIDDLPDGPATPAAVLARGYGNDVERALLLAALLRGAGHKADVVLARPRGNGPMLAAVGRLRGLTEAVVRLTAPDGKETWLEADSEDRAFGELDPDVQGSEGLDLATGKLIAVPVLPPAAEAKQRTVEVELAPDGTATVTDSHKLTGKFALEYRKLKNMTQEELQNWAIRFVSGEATGVDLLEFTHSDLGNANAEERMAFKYRVPALADKAGDFLVVSLPNARVTAVDVGRSTREYGLFWGGGEREEVTFVVRAPAGYAAYAVGQKVEKRGEGWSLAAEFAADPSAKGAVRFHETWERSALTAPKDAYAAYREARIARSRLRGEVIVFVKE